MEITSMLTLSTAHIRLQTVNQLNTEGSPAEKCLVIFPKREYGWFIHIPCDYEEFLAYDISSDFPNDLRVLMDYCHEHGIEWLCLDRDGPEEDDFPTYQWGNPNGKRCPQCGFQKFIVTAHVTQDWCVDEDGDFMTCLQNCVEVTHKPDDEDLWECVFCGFKAAGSEFNKKD